MRTRILIVIMALLFLGALFTVPRNIPVAHAAPVGTVCVAPLDASTAPPAGPCLVAGVTSPTAPNSTGYSPFTGPRTNPAHQIIVGVWVNNSDNFFGFDITLKASPVALTPADADLAGTILTGPTVFVKCIGGVLRSTSGLCQSTDTFDTIHFSAGTGTPATGTGLLFRAVWNITGTNPAVPVPAIHFQTGCPPPTSIGTGICVTLLSNVSSMPAPETFRTSNFDDSSAATVPFVSVSAPTISFGTRGVGDPTITETLTYTSNNGFSDTVSLLAVSASFLNPTPTCSGVLNSTSFTPVANGAVHVGLTITATGAGFCGVTVLGSYVLGALEFFTVTSSLVVPVTVSANYVDFSLSGSPTTVKFLTTGTASSTLTVTSLNSFSGPVSLATQSIFPTTSPALAVSFNSTSIAVPAAGSKAALVTFSSGVAATIYTVTLKGSATISGFVRTKTITLNVVEQDFSIQVTGSTLVTFNSGSTGSTTFTVSSKPSTSSGFTGTITITAPVNATGLTVSCPGSVTLTIGGSTSAGQSCNFSSSKSGAYQVTITGSVTASGTTVTHVAIVNVVVIGLTTTSLACVPSSVGLNLPTTCTATVTDTSSSPSTLTGTVSFATNSTGTFVPSTGSCTLAATATIGVAGCQVTYTPTVTGHHGITGTYGGDSTHSGSNGVFTLTVSRGTSTVVACSPALVIANQASQCTATVSDTSTGTVITPMGSVGFASNSTGTFSPTSCPLTATAPGVANCMVSYTPSVAGHHGITGTYGGDSAHFGSSGSFTLTVNPRTTTTSVSCLPASIVVNQQTNCTATVSDTSTGTLITPTGSVSFTKNSTGTFGSTSCVLTATGTMGAASCQVSYTPGVVDHHVITGTYGGDSAHSSSSGSMTVAVAVRVTSTAVSCSPSSVNPNQPTTCTATVSDTSTGTPITPTGNVGFITNSTGTFNFPSCSLSATTTTGVASCQVTYTPTVTGHHGITGTYGGDSTHSGSNGVFTLTVSRSSSTVVACLPASVIANQASQCTATVSDTSSGTAITPTGSISFSSNSTGTFSVPSCSLTATATVGVANCMVSYTSSVADHHGITGTYGGDQTHFGGSGTFTLTVGSRITSTSVSCLPASVVINQPLTCTATVSDISSGGAAVTPSGNVGFTSNSTGTFGSTSCPLTATATVGMASCQVSYLPGIVNHHLITGTYSGGLVHSGSNGGATVNASSRSTSTSVSCSPATVVINQAPQCTATVSDTSTGTAATPTGSVSFATNSTGSFSASSCSLTATTTVGVASCLVSYTASVTGSHGITATYAGDSAHSGGNSVATLTATSSSGGNVFGLPTVEFYAILGVVVAIVAVSIGLLLLRARRARPGRSVSPASPAGSRPQTTRRAP